MTVLAVLAVLLLRVHVWPWLIDKLSRPASPAEMDEIAVAAMPHTVPPFLRGSTQLFAVRIAGRDPGPKLLLRLSHGKFTALPGSMVHFTAQGLPSMGRFLVNVEPFRIEPFGTATGMVSSTYGNLGCEGWRFSLTKHHDKWTVTSQGLEFIC